MEVASVLESSGHTGTFPSTAESSWDSLELPGVCSLLWAGRASSFPLGWSCTPGILCLVLLLPQKAVSRWMGVCAPLCRCKGH